MNLPLIFASLMGGCCAGYEAENDLYRLGFTQDQLDARRFGPAPTADTGAAFRPGPTGGTGDPPTSADPADFTCEELCDSYDLAGCTFVPVEGEEVLAVECEVYDYCVGGRLHAAIERPASGGGADPVGAWLARMAHDELASAEAFRLLAAELRHHAAPGDLVDRVLQAAVDEVRHARMAGEAARRRGGVVPPVRRRALPPRGLEAIARENVEEACVLETWLALAAWVQAGSAAPELRPLFAAIAPDETRHATLAHDLDAWFRTRLGPEARARLDAARQGAVAALMTGDERAPMALGLPRGVRRQALLAGLASTVWRGV